MITKKLLTSLFLFCFFFSASFSWGQVSVGGSPVSQLAGVASLETVPSLLMRAVDTARLQAEDIENDLRKDGPWRFGENIAVNIDPNVSGKTEYLADGSLLWRVAIECPHAYHINLTFDNFELPEGAKMYVFNDNFSQMVGGFTAANNQENGKFATTLIRGSKIYIEYTEPANAPKNSPRIPFLLTRVTHGYRDAYKTIDAFGSSGSCNNNVNCPIGADWACTKRSVVMLVSGSNGFCTGTVVNNAAQDRAPYVLTANHCYSDPSTWVFWFNWESAGCTNPAISPAFQSMSGATLKARRANSDFCLVRINAAIPANYNPSFAGWDASGVTPNLGICIHHPSGDIKKISFTSTPLTTATYAVLTTNNGWKADWTSGVTEPGSSGSGIWDGNHRLVGQLYGGPSSCTSSAANKNDYFGKISSSWVGTTTTDGLKSWLDPNNTGVLTLDEIGCREYSLALSKPIDTICSSPTTRNYTLN